MKDEIKEILDYFRKYMSIDDCIRLSKIEDCITNLQHKLSATETNEETFRLEMQEITKILGLDENTLFDDVKEYARNLKEENKRLNNIIDELEKSIQKDIDRTKDLILEDSSMVEINNIRRMLNDTRQVILFRIKELKGGK